MVLIYNMTYNTILSKLIQEFPNSNWDWDYIFTYNYENVTFEFLYFNFNYINKSLIFDKYDIDNISIYHLSLESIKKCEKLKYINFDYDDHMIRLSMNDNITLDFVKENIDKPWKWEYLSYNKCITVDFIRKHLDKSWDWDGLSRHNPNLTIDIIEKNKDLPFNKFNLYSYNENMIFEYLLNNLEFKNWNLISMHKCITPLIINQNPEIPWSWKFLSNNPNLTINFIKKNINKDWNWITLSYNKCITWDFIRENINKDWDFKRLSYKEYLEFDIVLNNLNKPWDWDELSLNESITWEIVKENINLPWKFYYLSKNPNFTLEIAYEYKIDRNYNKWDILELSKKEIIPFENIKNNNYDNNLWNCYTIGSNLNLTYKDIKENLDLVYINPYKLSHNKFNYDPYFQSNIYKKRETKRLHDTIHEELISKACHPDRIFNWNEDFCIEYPEEYKFECEKWKYK